METPEGCFTRIGPGIAYKYWTRLESLCKVKWTSLFGLLVRDEEKVLKLTPGANVIKLFCP
jgi:hypothetical protein